MFDIEIDPVVAPSHILAELKRGAFNDVWKSEGTKAHKRAALNKARKIFWAYGITSPEDLPASRSDLEYFVDHSLEGGTLLVRSGLKNKKDARKWAKEYASILDVVTRAREAPAAFHMCDDDWADLLAYLSGQRDNPEIFGNFEIFSVISLANQCRRRGISIAALTAGKIRDFAPGLPDKTIAAVIKGVIKLNSLRGSNMVPMDLLPNVSPEELSGLVQPTMRVVPPLHPEFAELMETYIGQLSTGQSVAMFGTEAREVDKTPVGDARIKHIRTALRWLWHGLVAMEMASAKTGFDRTMLSRPVLGSGPIDCSGGA